MLRTPRFAALVAGVLALGATEVDEITDVPAPVVLDVLLYHVTEGRRAANSVVPKRNPRTITSLFGETFQVRSDLTIQDGLTVSSTSSIRSSCRHRSWLC